MFLTLKHRSNVICIYNIYIITFDNKLKACFSNKISYYNPNTPDTNCTSIFLIENPVFKGFLKIIGGPNQLPIT